MFMLESSVLCLIASCISAGLCVFCGYTSFLVKMLQLVVGDTNLVCCVPMNFDCAIILHNIHSYEMVFVFNLLWATVRAKVRVSYSPLVSACCPVSMC